MTITPLQYLSADDVRRALPMPDAIEAMRGAFRQLSDGQVRLPARQHLDAPGENNIGLVMSCQSDALNLLSVKFITVFHENRQRDLPVIQSLVILTDGATGSHVAVMDGVALTALRTGAACGVATDLLARPDAAVVALFGAGPQARTQLEAICCVRAVRRASIYDTNSEAADRFAAEMTRHLGVPVESRTTPAATLQDADIVCTATTSTSPVFQDGDLPPGAHINAIGSFRPDMKEIPSATVCRAHVVVDHLASIVEEAGDLLEPLERGLIQRSHFSTELGEILSGRSPGRRGADEVTLFKSVGVAIQDLCAAATAWENARRLKLGKELSS